MEKNRIRPIAAGKSMRMSYSRQKEVLEMPNLIEVQKDSYKWFLEEGLKEVFDDILREHLETGDYFRCAYRSLAGCYAKAVEEIEHNTKREYHKLYIVGGGARNQYLNRLTEEMSGKKVIALPIESSAIGNIKVQMEVEYEL